MAKGKKDKDDQYDSPWKEVIEQYFAEFMAFFFPKAFDSIDWSKGYQFLDKELQKVESGSSRSSVRRHAVVGEGTSTEDRVNKIVKVWRKSGEQAWLEIHIGLQRKDETEQAKQMFVSNFKCILVELEKMLPTVSEISDDEIEQNQGEIDQTVHEMGPFKISFNWL